MQITQDVLQGRSNRFQVFRSITFHISNGSVTGVIPYRAISVLCTEKEIEFQHQVKGKSLKVTIYGPLTVACFLTLDKSGQIYLFSQ